MDTAQFRHREKMIKRYIHDHEEVKNAAIAEAIKLMQDNTNVAALLPYAEKKMLAAVGQDKASEYAKFKCLAALINGYDVNTQFDEDVTEPVPAAQTDDVTNNPDVLSGPTENPEGKERFDSKYVRVFPPERILRQHTVRIERNPKRESQYMGNSPGMIDDPPVNLHAFAEMQQVTKRINVHYILDHGLRDVHGLLPKVPQPLLETMAE
eukprot:2452187-Amphidinium_carterae.1